MSRLAYQAAYQRNLPHVQPEGGRVFATFRLAGTLPKALLDRWKEERKTLIGAIERSQSHEERTRRQLALHRAWFARMEGCLDRAQTGPLWLKRPEAAQVVSDALHFLNGKKYSLTAHSIMPNHVHAVFVPLPQEESLNQADTGRIPAHAYHSLAAIMHSLKGFTANRCNGVLGRTGAFWAHESYDHIVRDEAEEGRIVEYVVNNPVKAGLVRCWREWPWNFWSGAP